MKREENSRDQEPWLA